ncbi:MAG: hypothetical protein NW201_04070 [Gemmatimonadales bacterium]|nr:hypothetical protein [Gemmatimonadales bacterium]
MPRPPFFVPALAASLLAWPAAAAAQGTLKPNTPVRVTLGPVLDRARVVGAFARWDPDSLHLETPDHTLRTVPIDRIERVEVGVRTGPRRTVGGAIIGSAVGAAAGLAAGGWGIFAGSVGGAAFGAALGSTRRGLEWQEAALPDRAPR